MATSRVSGSVVCDIGASRSAARTASYAGALAKVLGAPLTAVPVEPAVPASADRLAAALGEDRAATLLRLADAERAQLWVVGVGGRTGPAASLGRVTRELVLRATCPVLVIPRGAPPPTEGWTRRPVLCIFDGADGARPALNMAAEAAERLGTVAFVAHVGAGSVTDIQTRARTEQPAMIVTASCGTDAWHAARLGAAPVRLATSGSTPVLFVPPGYRAAATRSPRIAIAAGQRLDPAPHADATVARSSASTS